MLGVKNLSVNFGLVKAVDGVSFSVRPGEILGLLGESGSGKSTIALSILRLISLPGKITSGEILLEGVDLLKLSEEEIRKVRGAKISMIFQDPFSSLNPVLTIGEQIAEVYRFHEGLDRKAAWQKSVEMLDTVHIKDPAQRAHDYPHQFSGGMRQRAMIAMALACQPDYLIADEPTTALDVTIQAEILRLLQELQAKFNLGILFITHNFAIVRQLCERVVVMRAGRVVEEGEMRNVMREPHDAYTKNLIECVRILAGG